jgi:hypothetical protein
MGRGRSMQPSTPEKALHRWTPWPESIVRARATLGFTPLPSGEELRLWQGKNNDAVWLMAKTEMGRLGLPESAGPYWMACFYSDYLRSDGSIDYDAIREVIFAPLGEFGEKTYPLLYQCSADASASTRQELLAMRIKPKPDAISPLPRQLEQIIKSTRGRGREWTEIEAEVNRGMLGFEDMLRKIAESGDMQARWFSIRRMYTGSLKRMRRGLLNRVYGIGSRIWKRAGRPKPPLSRGAWSQGLFVPQ